MLSSLVSDDEFIVSGLGSAPISGRLDFRGATLVSLMPGVGPLRAAPILAACVAASFMDKFAMGDCRASVLSSVDLVAAVAVGLTGSWAGGRVVGCIVARVVTASPPGAGAEPIGVISPMFSLISPNSFHSSTSSRS
jgi:hypothetical protein